MLEFSLKITIFQFFSNSYGFLLRLLVRGVTPQPPLFFSVLLFLSFRLMPSNLSQMLENFKKKLKSWGVPPRPFFFTLKVDNYPLGISKNIHLKISSWKISTLSGYFFLRNFRASKNIELKNIDVKWIFFSEIFELDFRNSDFRVLYLQEKVTFWVEDCQIC